MFDLAVTWNPDWPQVLEAGWGLFATVVVGASFVLVAVRPGAAWPALVQLAVATASLGIATVVAREAPLAWFAVGLALQTAVVGLLLRGVLDDRAGRRGVSRPLVLLAASGAVPWLAYALDMWAANRDELPGADITNGIDHYSMQGALALALCVLPTAAALRPGLRPFVPACAGAAAAYLGLVSLAWPDADGGLSTAWSAAALAWGVALLLLAWRPT
jgi:hypothetical protein